jgi:hypothetical protein
MEALVKIVEEALGVKHVVYADDPFCKNEYRFCNKDGSDSNFGLIHTILDNKMKVVQFVMWRKNPELLNPKRMYVVEPFIMDTLGNYEYNYLMNMGKETILKELKKINMQTKLLK